MSISQSPVADKFASQCTSIRSSFACTAQRSTATHSSCIDSFEVFSDRASHSPTYRNWITAFLNSKQTLWQRLPSRAGTIWNNSNALNWMASSNLLSVFCRCIKRFKPLCHTWTNNLIAHNECDTIRDRPLLILCCTYTCKLKYILFALKCGQCHYQYVYGNKIKGATCHSLCYRWHCKVLVADGLDGI